MKKTGRVAAAVAAVLFGVAACGDSVGGGDKPDSLTVWLMPEAKESWPKAIQAANAKFQKKHPGVNVEIRYQDWTKYLTKFEAALADRNPPDVLEMGNTQTQKYMASGALMDLTGKKATFDNSKKWLDGLEKSCMYEGKLYCVPYYAAGRAVIYRKDMFEKAGITKEPSSLSEFVQACEKLMAEYGDKSNFSAWYFPGKYWYGAMPFVYDYGGKIAKKKNGKWQGALSSSQARKGLKKLKEIVNKYSAASKTADEESRNQVFAEGNVAMLYGVSYDAGVITGKEEGNPELAGKLGAFPMPSHTPDKNMPTFLGGSDLAVPATTDAPELAQDWIRIYTSTSSMKMMVKNSVVLPNTTSLLDAASKDPISTAFAEAAKRTWFVPPAKNWATVEQRNIIPNMLVKIFTGQASVEQATATTSKQLTKTLNG